MKVRRRKAKPKIAKGDALRYILRLYVTGQTPRSLRSIENLRRLCEKYLKGQFDLEIIDIYQQPALASEGQIIAAPTLIKTMPLAITSARYKMPLEVTPSFPSLSRSGAVVNPNTTANAAHPTPSN